MNPVPLVEPSPRPDDMAGYRAVACAVIERALNDARGVGPYPPSAPHRAIARAWLRHSTELDFWCAVASLNAERVRRVALAGSLSRRRPAP